METHQWQFQVSRLTVVLTKEVSLMPIPSLVYEFLLLFGAQLLVFGLIERFTRHHVLHHQKAGRKLIRSHSWQHRRSGFL